MAKDLNLALKKDVFESLQNGTTNEIIIEGSRWWKKRLMDLDTGKFKDFTIARVSSGSSDKVEYEIERIEQRGADFAVIVYVGAPENTPVTPDEDEQPCIDNGDSDFDNEPIQYSDGAVQIIPETINPDVIEPVTINPVTVETCENGEIIVKMPYVKPISEITQKIILNQNGEAEVVDGDGENVSEFEKEIQEKEYRNIVEIKDSKLVHTVTNLFNRFCEMSNVYVVNMPNVTIRNNGQIFGSNRKLIADRDSDVRFDFTKKEFIKNPNSSNSSFVIQILKYLTNLMNNNYVFVNKNMSGFRNGDMGNLIFTITAVAKRKYFFERKK